jgi:hypothetical protein
MNEREMEDLVCAYPEEFWQRKELKFVERQHAFPGVGRFDVLFSDRFGNQILMELKAVTARSADADQLVRYQEALSADGHLNIILWLVAPMIPKQTADFLDRYGVEHSQITEAEFRQVAIRHGYSFASEQKSSDQLTMSKKSLREKEVSGASAPFTFAAGRMTASEKEFLGRCDEDGKWFFSALFDRQRAESNKSRITWNHESGFSIQFRFPRIGFVPFVWGFPGSNLNGRVRQQRIEFPFHFARKKAPTEFINDFGNALTSVRGLNSGLKPGFAIGELSRPDLERLQAVIFEFVEKASTYPPLQKT